jgi:SAM-dependent methyltransferase
MSFQKVVPHSVSRLARSILRRIPLSIGVRRSRPTWPGEYNRWGYQSLYVDLKFAPNDRVLDIGSGGDPFPYSTHLVDRYLEPTPHRNATLARDVRPLISADIQSLPFLDKSFSFIYCSHVLEHVDDPIETCKEIIRVGQGGFIETPTMGKDILFAWTNHTHKWHVVSCESTLCFFEYSPRQSAGIGSSAWRDIINDSHYHPLQEAFYKNLDIFNVLFTWKDRFSVFVFRRDGSVESLNAECKTH